MESWLEMAIAMMKPTMPIVFMMEVTVVEGVPTLTNAKIVCVTMEEHLELIHHVSAIFWLLNDLASKFEQRGFLKFNPSMAQHTMGGFGISGSEIEWVKKPVKFV